MSGWCEAWADGWAVGWLENAKKTNIELVYLFGLFVYLLSWQTNNKKKQKKNNNESSLSSKEFPYGRDFFSVFFLGESISEIENKQKRKRNHRPTKKNRVCVCEMKKNEKQ